MNMIKKSWMKHTLWLALLAASFCACTDDISQTVGPLPDEALMNNIGGQLVMGNSILQKKDVRMYEGDGAVVEEVALALTKPSASAQTIQIETSSELVQKYNEAHNMTLKPFPEGNAVLENGGSLSITVGQRVSNKINLTLSSDGLESDVPYLLAVTVKEKNGNLTEGKQTLYYRILFRKRKTTTEIPSSPTPIPIPELCPGLFSVFYVNTEYYQPLIASAWGAKADNMLDGSSTLYSLGNIVNLKKATLGYDGQTKRCVFRVGADLSYVLEHRDKYIRHLQELGRKVCICIENAGEGLGFCNLSDSQIDDFAKQVKEVVYTYGIDGINLWEDVVQYDEPDMPGMNTVSYPKLIKALRTAMPDKLLTLVDKGEATEYFYDEAKCGGIRVGEYIDYAWHGYVNSTEVMQIITPNFTGEQSYSQYSRKPIAGLSESCYGSVVVPWYKNTDAALRDESMFNTWLWRADGLKKNDIAVFGFDLIGQEYQEREGAVRSLLELLLSSFLDDGIYWNPEIGDIDFGEFMYYPDVLDKYVGNPTGFYQKDW